MKRFCAAFALLLASCEEAPREQVASGLPEVAYASFQERVEKVILPKVEFNETPIKNVLVVIQELSQIHADDQMGISILVDLGPQQMALEKRITLRMEQASLKEVLEAVAEQIHVKVIFEELGRAVFRPLSYDPTPLTEVYEVSPLFLETLRIHGLRQAESESAPDRRDLNKDSVISYLESCGVSFGASASATLDVENRKMTVVNEGEQIALVDPLVKHIDGVYDALMDDPKIHRLTEIRKNLDETILPKVKFHETPLSDALSTLHWDNQTKLPSMIFDFGAGFDLQGLAEKNAPVDKGPVTVDLENVSLRDAFGAILDQANAKLVVEPFAIKMVPKWLPDPVYLLRCFDAPPEIFDVSLPKQRDPFGDAPESPESLDSPSVKAVLESVGITFPGESNAVYDVLNRQLVVRTTEDQLPLIKRFIEFKPPAN